MTYLKQKKPDLFITNILILINVLIIGSGAFMVPLWSDFVLKIGGNIQSAGQAVFVFYIVGGVLMCGVGRIEHHYQNDEWFMCFSQLIVFLSYLCYFFVRHIWQLYLVEIGLGIGGAFQTPVISSIYQRYFTQHQSALFWAVWNGFYNIAMGVGAFCGAFLVSHYGYRLMFSVLTTTAFVCLVVTLLLMMKITNLRFTELWKLKS